MSTPSEKIRTAAVFVGLSIIVHLLVIFSLGLFAKYKFTAPLDPLQAVMVDLSKPVVTTAPVTEPADRETSDKPVEDVTNNVKHDPLPEENSAPPVVPDKSLPDAKPAEQVETGKEKTTQKVEPDPSTIPPPFRTAGEFLGAKTERLSYLISLGGMPVGTAEFEAKNVNGEVRITLRIKSNAAFTNVYPVNDLIETRHIAGNFVITKINKQEGDFRSNIGFTIFLRDKSIFWVDRIRNRYSRETIPNSEVLDALSGFYSLRRRPLQVGQTEILHIYDGDSYNPLPTEIIRSESIRLRNLQKIDTLVTRQTRKSGGKMRNTGEMFIWLTNDENKVPVKAETTFHFGKVTAELISADSEP